MIALRKNHMTWCDISNGHMEFHPRDGREYHRMPSQRNLLPRKLTWNGKMNPWNRRFILKTIIFRCYVSFREGSSILLNLLQHSKLYTSACIPVPSYDTMMFLDIIHNWRDCVNGIIAGRNTPKCNWIHPYAWPIMTQSILETHECCLEWLHTYWIILVLVRLEHDQQHHWH